MKGYSRIIFVGQTGSSRAPMAAGILNDFTLERQVEILARGMVVLFPEPINQKAEAVLISNGINPEGYTCVQLCQEDITSETLILVMEQAQREKILQQFENVTEDNVQVLTELVGDELEIVNPYGGTLAVYGLCYETLRKSIKKLVKLMNEGE